MNRHVKMQVKMKLRPNPNEVESLKMQVKIKVRPNRNDVEFQNSKLRGNPNEVESQNFSKSLIISQKSLNHQKNISKCFLGPLWSNPLILDPSIVNGEVVAGGRGQQQHCTDTEWWYGHCGDYLEFTRLLKGMGIFLWAAVAAVLSNIDVSYMVCSQCILLF